MEETKKNYQLKFEGNGGEYFGILIVNWLLTLVTLGIYYPWAKAKKLKYTYGVTSIDGNHFSFHGKGKELFIGMLKFIVLFIVPFLLVQLLILLESSASVLMIGVIVFYCIIIGFLPLAMHGSMRYRMSRTTLRGIRFGYRGNRGTLIKEFIKMFLLTLITFGIYGAWMQMNLRKYMVGNVRYGEVEGRFKGDGGDYFVLNLKGYFLSLITLGIYMFWWQKDLFAYSIDNMSFHKDEQEIKLKSTMTGGGLFGLQIVNLLLTIVTLGFGFAWVEMRTMKFYTESIIMEGDIDLASLTQTEEEYNNAFGEDALDFFDMDLF
jgi:Predicted membrane protein